MAMALDNRLENLQLLCPNCHSQTDNFSGSRAAAASGGSGLSGPEPDVGGQEVA